MKIREFNNNDARFCFTTRSRAYIEIFYNEIGAKAVAEAVNTYMPEDYITMAGKDKIFILEYENNKAGFIYFKRIDKATAELPLIYLTFDAIGKGIGSKAIDFMENWIKTNWTEISLIIIDTIIPNYNNRFYEKMGYKNSGSVTCSFNNFTINAVRFTKSI